jgi:gamma-glutamylaminecyclotransferase
VSLVFVYGTLKRGYGNNYILRNAAFVSEGQTLARCRLFNSGFPVLRRRLNRDGPWNAPVRGEVFEVTDAATMRRLDSLEGEGRMYHRRRKKIQLDNGQTVMAFAYVGDARAFRHCRIYPTPVGAYEWSRL